MTRYKTVRTYVSGNHYTASYTDANGVLHTHDFTTQKAANKWQYETMPARDIKIHAKATAKPTDWGSSSSTAGAKRKTSSGTSSRTASAGKPYVYHPAERFPGADAEWTGTEGRVGGRRFKNYDTWRTWAEKAAVKNGNGAASTAMPSWMYTGTGGAQPRPARPTTASAPAMPVSRPTFGVGASSGSFPTPTTAASRPASSVGCGTIVLVLVGLWLLALVIGVVGWIVTLVAG